MVAFAMDGYIMMGEKLKTAFLLPEDQKIEVFHGSKNINDIGCLFKAESTTRKLKTLASVFNEIFITSWSDEVYVEPNTT